MNKKQTVEERFKEMNRNCAGAYNCGKFPPEVLKFIKAELKANDDAWRSKVLELKAILEKNKDEPVTGNVVLLELNNIFIDLGENK